MKKSDYFAIRFPETTPRPVNCYLCLKPLVGAITPDHVIPTHIFEKGDPYRPQLLVHSKCNSEKSKDDEWFCRQIQLRSTFNSSADSHFSHFMEKAIKEKSDAYIIGKRPRNYIFARGIFNNINWGLTIIDNNTEMHQLFFSEKDVDRFTKYVSNLCRGLYIRSNQGADPTKPRLRFYQYPSANNIDFIKSVQDTMMLCCSTLFSQQWGDRIFYFGSQSVDFQNGGILFIEFYQQFGVFALFDVR